MGCVRLRGDIRVLQPSDERWDAAKLRDGDLVGGRVAREGRARIEHALGTIGRAHCHRAKKPDKPLRDDLPIVLVL